MFVHGNELDRFPGINLPVLDGADSEWKDFGGKELV